MNSILYRLCVQKVIKHVGRGAGGRNSPLFLSRSVYKIKSVQLATFVALELFYVPVRLER